MENPNNTLQIIIKSLLLSHHHSTCALVSEILESVLWTPYQPYHTPATPYQHLEPPMFHIEHPNTCPTYNSDQPGNTIQIIQNTVVIQLTQCPEYLLNHLTH